LVREERQRHQQEQDSHVSSMYSVAKVAAITYRLWCRFDRLLRAKLVQAYLLLFAGQTAVSRRNRRATLGIARNDAAMHVGQAEIAFLQPAIPHCPASNPANWADAQQSNGPDSDPP